MKDTSPPPRTWSRASRWALAAVLVSACTAPADDVRAPEEAAPESGWVSIDRGDRRLRAWLAHPDVEGQAPTILVIHQNRGMSDWVRSVADRLAEAGYIALAPDLLSGTGPGGGDTEAFVDSDAAREGIYALDPEQVTADLNAAADYLSGLSTSDGTVAVGGFCWGGSQSFRFATNRNDLKAAYVFYGTAPEDVDALRRINAPVFGFYGGEDNRVNATIERTSSVMAGTGKTYRSRIFPGAGHGFMGRGESADEGDANRAAMDAAWSMWLELLQEGRGGA